MFSLRSALLASLVVLATSLPDASAQTVDLTVFVGRSYPVDGPLRFTPALPVFPRVAIRETGPLEIEPQGGPVFGVALAVEAGIVGLEGRLDAADISFAVNGTRYVLVATAPTTMEIGSVTFDRGTFDVKRLKIASVNVRLRTPGPVGLVASGGLSYLPEISIEGALPVTVEAPGIISPATVEASTRLVGTPDPGAHRWGVNGGAGLRVGAGRMAVLVEARAFYFRTFELRFEETAGQDLLSAVTRALDSVRFEPVVVTAQVGLVVRF